MVYASDRAMAIDRLARALDEAEVAGIQTTLPFHRFVAGHPAFRGADLSTGWVAEHWDGAAAAARAEGLARLAAALAWPGLSHAPRPPAIAPGRTAAVAAGWSGAALEAGVDRWPA
jgi:acetyl/propionyl-CoA carboxylase alpha subunit